jgi:hypothetical protein
MLGRACLTRNLPAFAEFLTAAALVDGRLVNYTTIARDCGVSAYTVKEYFQVLVDTLLGSFLPSYRQRPKRRVIQSPKFYFADVGVVNRLARRGRLARGSGALRLGLSRTGSSTSCPPTALTGASPSICPTGGWRAASKSTSSSTMREPRSGRRRPRESTRTI